jgi:hypothetical protein
MFSFVVRIKHEKGNVHTFAESFDALSINTRASFVDICHEKMTEFTHDCPANSIGVDPLLNTVCFDVAELLERQFLFFVKVRYLMERLDLTRHQTYGIVHVVVALSFIVSSTSSPTAQ